MRAGQASADAGVSVKALRYYEGISPLQPVRLANGCRDYSAQDVQLAAEIRALMSLGLAPKEPQPFLDCLLDGHDDADDCPESLAAYQDKIDRLDLLIARLAASRDALSAQMHTAARRGFGSGSGETESRRPPQPDPLPDEPGIDMPRGWNQIPGAGACGCSQQACSFRDDLSALQSEGAQRVLALSTDAGTHQQDRVRRLHLPYPMISDPELTLAQAMDLPTFRANPARSGS